jgi:vitamin B12 transporter
MGGVINIITKKATSDELSGEVGSEFGSNHYQRYNAAVRGIKGKFDYSFAGEWLGENDISAKKDNSEKDAFRRWSSNIEVGYQLTDQLRLSGFGRYANSDEEYDDAYSAPKNRGNFHIIDLQLGTKLSAEGLFDDHFDSSFGFSFSKVRRADTEGTSFYLGKTLETDWQNILRLDSRNKVLFGVTYTEERAEQDFFGTSSGRSRTDSYYGQYELEPIDNLFLTSGIRYTNHSEFGGDTTYSLSGAYLIKESGTKLKSSFATGYRAPSLYELNYQPTMGTGELDPEESQSFDLGFEQTVNEYIEFGVNYFRNRITDYIGYNPGAGWPSLDYYEQVSGVKIYGVESYLKITAIDSVTFDFTHTYQHSNNMQREIAPMVYQPTHCFDANIHWDIDSKWELNLNVNYVGAREYDNYVWPMGNVRSTRKLHGYTLLNLSTTCKLTDYFQIYGRIDNLLDQDYEVSSGYNTNGITTYVGVRYIF